MNNYNPDVLKSPRDSSGQRSELARTLNKTKSTTRVAKPKARVMSIDVDKGNLAAKPKKKVLKEEPNLVYNTTGPKTPVVKKTKAPAEKLKVEKGKSTIRKSAKKINVDLPGSPQKASKVSSKFVDGQNFKNQYIEPVRLKSAAAPTQTKMRSRVSKTQRRSIGSEVRGSNNSRSKVSVTEAIPP